jgi:hypothetical protein
MVWPRDFAIVASGRLLENDGGFMFVGHSVEDVCVSRQEMLRANEYTQLWLLTAGDGDTLGSCAG